MTSSTTTGTAGVQGDLWSDRADDWAEVVGTINYEIVCGIAARVPRVYHRDGEPA